MVAVAHISLKAIERILTVKVQGRWSVDAERAECEDVLAHLESQVGECEIRFDAETLEAWDSTLVVLLVKIYRLANLKGWILNPAGLPEGTDRLAKLALAVEEREGARKTFTERSIVERLGASAIDAFDDLVALVRFSGEVILSLQRFVRRQAIFRKSDVLAYLQEAGSDALPIVALISFLLGMIFAFVGIMQLKLFGAGIYTADLVAIAMVRELAPIMTAIVIAGRTGAAYAAQLGTMKVNEELDALTTLGIHPIDYLVTPRVFALVLMMPFLTMYASLFGIMGGTVVSMSMLDESLTQYVSQTIQSLNLKGLFSGLFKATVYGSLVAIAGCHQGMACGNSALAVGQSTTQAVVSSIVLIVVSAATLTVIYINLGI